MGGDDASADESAAIIAQQKAQLALLRSQVAELELSLAQHKDGAPPVSNAPPQPPLAAAARARRLSFLPWQHRAAGPGLAAARRSHCADDGGAQGDALLRQGLRGPLG
jgi:hypothetical protein